MYDDCVQNNVYYFAVTNLKQWVFGSFVSPPHRRYPTKADGQNSSYSACTTSPVIERKQKEPSLMQCLTTWVVRSVDEVSLMSTLKQSAELTSSDPEPERGESKNHQTQRLNQETIFDNAVPQLLHRYRRPITCRNYPHTTSIQLIPLLKLVSIPTPRLNTSSMVNLVLLDISIWLVMGLIHNLDMGI